MTRVVKRTFERDQISPLSSQRIFFLTPFSHNPMVRRIAKKENTVLSSKRTFTIDYAKPARDGIFDDEHVEDFQKYLSEHIKINGKTNALGEKVRINAHDKKMQVTSYIGFSKRYFKYLTKRYLKKKTLRDWLRVVSTSKDRYELRYYNIQQDGEEEN